MASMLMPPATLTYIQPEPPTVQEIIIEQALEHGVDPDTALSIAWAESRFKNVPNHKYTDENGLYTAYGIFQINASTYAPYCGEAEERFEIEKNIECAMIIMSEKNGLNHWSESFQAWKNLPVKTSDF